MPEDKIFLLSLLMAEMGVHSVAYAFPQVRILTTAVDKRVNDLFRIIPGIGEAAQGRSAVLGEGGGLAARIPATRACFLPQGTSVTATSGPTLFLTAVMRKSGLHERA